MKITCTKPQAATRQLDVAITLLFSDCDPLVVRTLAAAAHGILADLVDSNLSGGSWRSKIIQDSGLSKKDTIASLNNAQNYLKHADKDSNTELLLDQEENDHAIFITTLEYVELGYELSINMQAFQLWYLASYPENIGIETEPVRQSLAVLPNMSKLSREERLARGAEFLASVR